MNIIHQFLIYFFIFSAFAPSTYSSECLRFLENKSDGFITLPGKNNSFSRQDIGKLSVENRYLISILSAGMTVLDEAEVVSALKAINQPLSFFVSDPLSFKIPEELLKIAKHSAVLSTVTENYIFFKTYLGDSIAEGAIQGLSLLFSQIKRPKKAISFVTLQPEAEQDQLKLFHYFENLTSEPRNAKAIIDFFENEKISRIGLLALETITKELTDKLNSILESKKGERIDFAGTYSANMSRINRIREFNVELLKSEYNRKRKFSPDSTFMIMTVITEFLDLMNEYYLHDISEDMGQFSKRIGLISTHTPLDEDISDLKDLPWEKRLYFIESFIVYSTGFTSNLNDITYVLDHLLFGSATPLTTEALEASIVNSIKSWIIPVKSELASKKLLERAVVTQQPENQVDSNILNRAWGYAAPSNRNTNSNTNAPNPNKRRNQDPRKPVTSARVSQIENASTSKPIEIEDEENLFHFTSHSQNQRPLQNLESEKVYKLKFMREGQDAEIQTVDFSREVIKLFSGNSEKAQRLIRALNLGFAKNQNEDGLKILKLNQPGQTGRYYELKSMGYETRLLVHHIDGHWRVLKVTDKTNIDRVARDLRL